MKISSRVDYAISCLIHVARQYEKGTLVSIPSIAEQEQLEIDYVEQLLISLKRAGIVTSVRGVKGGYKLSRHPREICAREIMCAFDPEILELICKRPKGRRTQCTHLECCQVRGFWIGLKEHMESYLNSVTLERLVELRNAERTKEQTV